MSITRQAMEDLCLGDDGLEGDRPLLASSLIAPELRCNVCGRSGAKHAVIHSAVDDPALLARIDDLLYLMGMRDKYLLSVQSRMQLSAEEARMGLLVALVKTQRENEEMRETCSFYEGAIRNVQFSIAKSLASSRTLEERLSVLKKTNAELAEYKSQVLSIREHLGLKIMKTKKMVESFRITSAIDVLEMFCMKAYPSYASLILEIASNGKSNNETCHLFDCATIFGIPVPNIGTFEGVPADVCRSYMQFAAHAVHCVSHVMNVQLPHPLRLFSTTAAGGGGNYISPCSAQGVLIPFDDASSTRALSLLRVNIVVACIKCGLGVHQLFPPQACILNLILLREFLSNKLVTDYHSDREVKVLADNMAEHGAEEHPLRFLYSVSYGDCTETSDSAPQGKAISDWEIVPMASV